jgi:hypothetical protein
MTDKDPCNPCSEVLLEPITISMVRKIIPNLIADDIISVQPMTGIAASAFEWNNRISFDQDELGGLSKEEVIEILKETRPELFV